MTHVTVGIPAELRLAFEAAPSPETRRALGDAINAFHARTVPQDAQRFALLLHDAAGRLVAGLSGAALVAVAVRRGAVGQRHLATPRYRTSLLAQAEAHAMAAGCHSVWLDTFQAREFYLAGGYQQFGALDDYPPGQTRYFLRKTLAS